MTSLVEKLSIYIFWFAAVFDPIGTIGGLRYIALILIFLVLLNRFCQQQFVFRVGDFYFWIFGFFVLLLPVYGTIVGLLRGGFNGKFIDTSYIGTAVLFSCSLIYLNNNLIVVGFRALIASLRAMSIVTILIWLALQSSIGTTWVDFLRDDALLLAERPYGGYNFYFIYFIASPMIIYLMVYEIWRFLDKPSTIGFVLSAVPVFALFLSGTRMSILIAVFGPTLIFFWRKWGPISVLLGSILVVAVYFLLKFMGIEVLASMFDPNGAANAIKIGYLKLYMEIFSDPVTIIFGQGLNAQVWSKVFADMLTGAASRTELTYLEFFRVFGLVIGAVFIFILWVTIKKLGECDYSWRWLSAAVFLYLCASSLNPYLFSSNGILPLGFCAAVLYMNADQIRMKNKKQQEIS